MRIGRLNVHTPQGSMGCIAGWSYETGYWRWALYWDPLQRGFGASRARSVTGSIYPHFGCNVITPLGTLRLATQPAMSSMKKARFK